MTRGRIVLKHDDSLAPIPSIACSFAALQRESCTS
jgi:hypothetical protein